MTARRPPPPSARELRRQPLPLRVLGRQDAARYCTVGVKLFTQWVREGKAPAPKLITTRRSTLERWTIDSLDEFIDSWPTKDADGRPTPPTPKLLSF